MQQTKIALAVSFVLASAAAQAQFAATQVSPSTGAQAWATGDYSVAIGQNTIAGTTQLGGNPSLAITPTGPYRLQTAVGSAAIAWGMQDSAYGAGAVAASMSVGGTSGAATSIGAGATTWGPNNVAVGYLTLAGATSPGGPLVNPTIYNATALGGQASAGAIGSTAVGALSSASGTNATALGTGAVAMGNNSVALGAGTFAGQDNTVAVGGRRLVGLANGTAATDAVTVQQLQAAIAGVGGVDPAAILNQANSYTDQAINSLRREYSRAIAAVAAAPSLPALSSGERALAIGTGIYNGQQSLGIAYGQALASGAVVNAGISTAGSGKAVARAGMAWKF